LTLSTLALVLLAALIHATWNLLAKKASGGAAFVLLITLAVLVIYTPVIAIWWWQTPGLIGGITAMQWLFIFASAIVHIGYSLALQRGYQLADYGIVYPVARGTGPLISSAVAIVFFGEAVSVFSATGIMLIVCGIFVLAGGLRLLSTHDAQAMRGVRWGAITGLTIAAYTSIDGYSVKFLAMSPLLLDYFANLLRALFLLPYVWRQRDELQRQIRINGKYALIIGAISPLAYILVLTAMQTAPISHVAPLRELSMLFAALFGARLLGEKQLGEKFLGAALMLTGVIGLLWH
jgi:drug/metabolite transporter (DMT)-like permease